MPTASGRTVPLAQVASVETGDGREPIIRRYSRVPTLSVRSDIVERAGARHFGRLSHNSPLSAPNRHPVTALGGGV